MNEERSGGESVFTGGLVVVSGPSGSGKTSICNRLREHDRVRLSVSATTRPQRPGEVAGRDYYFMDGSTFREKIARGEFVEYNEVFKNGVLYGSLKAPLEEGIADRTRYYVMEIDVVGGLSLKDQDYEGLYIFIKPPSLEALRARLCARGTESEEELAGRLRKAEWEIEKASQYDRIIVNDDLERAVRETEEYLGLR